MRRRLRGVLLAMAWLATGPSAAAQDDWSITRERPKPSRTAPAKPRTKAPSSATTERAPDASREPDLSERYYRALLARPDDAFALERLRTLTLAKHGSLAPLVERLTSEVAARPDDLALREALVRTLALAGRSDDAVRELEAVLSLPSAAKQGTRLWLLRGELARDARRLDDAVRAYEQVATSSSSARDDRRAALRALGDLALEAGDVAGAEKRYATLAAEAPRDATLAAEWPRALARAGRHAEAAHAYLAVTSRLRGDVRGTRPLLREAAREALEAGETELALECVERALAQSSPGERAELYDVLVEGYRRSQRLPELVERLEREARTHAELRLRVAMLWDELGDETRAVEGYRAWLRSSPRDIDTRARLARLLVRSGRLDEVVTEYEALVKLAPDEPAFVTELAQLLRDAGRRDEALTVLSRASARAGRSLAMHRALAEIYARWGLRDEAERELSLLATLDPGDTSHVIALGDEAFERGDRALALRTWQRLLERGGDRSEAHATLGSVLGDHGLLEEALAQLERAVALAPDRVDHRRALASLLERAGKGSEAEAAWQWVLAHAGADAVVRREARQHIVGLWVRSGLAARRIPELDARFRASPPDLEAGRMLAELVARDPTKAATEIAVLEQIAKLDPKDVDTLRALERAYTRRGALAAARRTLDRLIVADPAAAPAYLARAVDLSLAMYEDEAALAYAQRAVELQPKDGKALRLLGDLFRRRQDAAQAAQAYERAASLDPRDAETRLLLAQLETARGRTKEARRWLLEVVRSSPDDELVSRAARTAMQLGDDSEADDALAASLLELALAHPERVLFRRLLVESFASSLSPIAERLSRGRATNAERERLERTARGAIKPLLEALADADPGQREVALSLLGAARIEHAARPLMTLAEQGDVTAERAKALIAVGRIGDPSVAPRLRALVTRGERRLTPLALWALARSEGARASDVLLARLADDRDASVRVVAALALGALDVRAAEPLLVAAARDRHAQLRAAGLWALARIDPGAHRELFTSALEGPPVAAAMALMALSEDDEVMAGGLLARDPEQRRLAAQLAAGASARHGELPPPPWPFSARDYFDVLFGAELSEPSSRALEQRWGALVGVLERRLRGGAERSAVLDALVPVAAGLSLRAFDEAGSCLPGPLAQALAQRLRPALRTLADARSERPEDARTALALLAASGGADDPLVLRALGGEDTAQREVVLEALTRAPSLPDVTAAELERAYGRAADWPTRMRIARALRGDVARRVLAREPMAVVRQAATHTVPHADATAPRCDGDPPRN